jgi:hypothetical protein
MNTYEKQGEGGIHLVNTLPTMHPETGEDGSEQVIFDMPRPIRDEHPARCASPAYHEPFGDSVGNFSGSPIGTEPTETK